MADILLSALPSASATQPVQSLPITAPITLAQPLLPPAIAALPNGALLEGFVINRDAQGNPILRTGKGDFLVQVQNELFLKTGAEVVIRISVQNGQTSATLVSVDAKPVAQLLQQQSTAQLMAGAATRTTLPVLNAPLQAVLLSPITSGTEQQTQQNFAAILRIPAAQLPPIDKGLALLITLPSAPTAPATVPTTIPAATTPVPAQATSAAPIAAAPAATVTASVIGHEGNATIVRSEIGSVKIFTPAPLPVGSQLTLGIALHSAFAPSAPPSVFAPQAQSTASLLESITHASQLGEDWESLREVLQHFSGAARAGAEATGNEITSRIPSAKAQMISQVLFFLAALRGSDIQQWIGKHAVDSLKVQSPRLLDRLSTDLSALRASATPQPDVPWQMLIFPMLHEEALQQVRLFWRREQPDDNEDAASSADETRFIFDLSLSQLGALQIDGLVKGQRPECTLNILIRSEVELAQDAQDELRGLYASASEAAGLAGQLRFSSGKSQLLTPLSEMRVAAAHGDAGSILA